MTTFHCAKCGSRRFWRRITKEQIVDWSREGSISGHPYLEGAPMFSPPIVFTCAGCGKVVDAKAAGQMEEQVL